MKNISIDDYTSNNTNNTSDERYNKFKKDKEVYNIIDIFVDEENRKKYIDENKIKIIESLLSLDNDNVNARNSRDESILMNSIKNNDFPVVELLLEKWADINQKDMFWNTALMIACKTKKNIDEEIIKLLLKNKSIKINETNNNKETALIYATQLWKNNIVKLLLEKWADISLCDKGRRNALMYAINFWNKEMINLILDKYSVYSNVVDTDEKTALMYAEEKWYNDIVKKIEGKMKQKIEKIVKNITFKIEF